MPGELLGLLAIAKFPAASRPPPPRDALTRELPQPAEDGAGHHRAEHRGAYDADGVLVPEGGHFATVAVQWT